LKEFFTAIFYIFVTVGVFVLTYYSTKFLSKRAGVTSRTKNLQLLEKIPVGKDKQVAILRVGDEIYLLGISNQSVQFSKPLTKTAAAKLVQEEPSPARYNPFSKKPDGADTEDKSSNVFSMPLAGLSGSSFMQYLTNKMANFLTNMIQKRKGGTHESKTANYTDYTK